MRLTTTILAILMTTIAFSQPTLTSENHALKDGIHNPMTLCEYADPGIAGADVIWDFSELVVKKEFTGHIDAVISHQNFNNANTLLEEFGSKFFFSIDDQSINQVGYTSKNGKSRIEYSEPFEKMRFPLSFENFHSKSFGGVYLMDNKQIGDITGNGTIDADAWGKLILPNNSVYENTLRVKSSKSYTSTFTNSEQFVEITTHRWYNSLHRYPLLVLTEIKTTTSKNENISYQAAYNNNAVSAIDAPVFDANSLEVYPNPAENNLFLSLTTQIATGAKIAIFDITGKNVFLEVDYPLNAGTNQISLSDEIIDLKAGTYLLSVTIDNQTETRELSIMD